MTLFDDGDDDTTTQPKPDEGGPEAGDYKTDPNMPIPDGNKSMQSGELG